MKRLLCLILAMCMVFALSACGNNNNDKPENEAVGEVVGTPESDTVPETNTEGENAPAEGEEPEANDDKPVDEKPADKPVQNSPENKPASKPEAPSTTNPSDPVTPPPAEEKPETPPATEAPSTGKTVGDTLAAVWRANTGKSAEEIANAVMAHSSIQFMGGVVPVEEGFLTGFDNTEIHGFSNGVMFAPAIGTIPFVGYVFELADGTDADTFVKTLKDGANPRWNICTEAEQTIVEKSGNKVFFLMCPKSFEE